MSSFPLYDKLLTDTDLSNTTIDKAYVLNKIKSMSELEHEVLYAIIKKYYITVEDPVVIIPYNGKLYKKSLKFDLDKLPTPLQQLIYTFTRLNSTS
jgi:hypothetical protein